MEWFDLKHCAKVAIWISFYRLYTASGLSEQAIWPWGLEKIKQKIKKDLVQYTYTVFCSGIGFASLVLTVMKKEWTMRCLNTFKVVSKTAGIPDTFIFYWYQCSKQKFSFVKQMMALFGIQLWGRAGLVLHWIPGIHTSICLKSTQSNYFGSAIVFYLFISC